MNTAQIRATSPATTTAPPGVVARSPFHPSQIPISLRDFTATSCASMAANFVTHPFEILKVRQQLSGSGIGGGNAGASLFHVARHIVSHEGLPALYRAFNASLVRATISGGGRLTLYNQLKLMFLYPPQSSSSSSTVHQQGEDTNLRLGNNNNHHSNRFWHYEGQHREAYEGTMRIVIAMVSGIAAACFAAPVDLAWTRLALPSQRGSRSIVGSLRQVMQESGETGFKRFAALYRGTSAVFARQAVFTAAQLTTFDRAKSFLSSLSYFQNQSSPVSTSSSSLSSPSSPSPSPPSPSLSSTLRSSLVVKEPIGLIFGASVISGFATTAAIAPFEMIKTHMQVTKQAGFWSTMKGLVQKEGLASLWRGSFPLCVKTAPHTLIVLMLSEHLRFHFGVPNID